MSRRLRATAAAGALALAAALGACSGGGDEGGDSPSSGAPTTSGTASGTETIAEDLEVQWDLAFLPDGAALVTLRDSGDIAQVEDDGETTPLGTVPGVAAEGEGGLLGVAVSPDFAEDDTIYVYATTEEDNRVLRMTLGSSGIGDVEPLLTGIPKGSNHNGGRLDFGPDGHLYVATGDAGDDSTSQDEDNLAGKILRITEDGEPAPGNPDEDSPVWSSGHRNVQGLAWREDGTMWASEFGQSTWDELNRITQGGNYGWPDVEGEGGGDDFVDPVTTWATADASPSGITVDEDGDVIMAALMGESLWRVPISGEGEDAEAGTPERLLEGEHGRLRHVELAPDGSLWVLTSNTFRGDPREGDDRVLRVDLD